MDNFAHFANSLRTMDDPQYEFKRWLAEKVAPHGTITKLSEATGIAKDKITRSKETESTDPKKRRQVPIHEMRAIAEFFGEVPPGLNWAAPTTSGDQAPLSNELRPAPAGELIPIRVSGRAKAGEFISVEDLGDWEEPETIYDTRDERFPEARHLGFVVDGDSMNALKPIPIPDGARVSALAYEDISESVPLRDGMTVVVERTRHGGLEREWSVKQLEIYDDRVEFHPRSTNPRHKPIVVARNNNADDGMMVTIIALVRGWSTKLSW
jgi:hypothetical protein